MLICTSGLTKLEEKKKIDCETCHLLTQIPQHNVDAQIRAVFQPIGKHEEKNL